MNARAYQDITPSQLDTLAPGTRRIDVREVEEFTGPLGHLPGAELVPLGTLEAGQGTDGWSVGRALSAPPPLLWSNPASYPTRADMSSKDHRKNPK